MTFANETPPIPEDHHFEEHTEIRTHFEEQLAEIQVRLVDLATQVLTNMRRTNEIVLENRLDEVATVVAADDPINEEYTALEGKVFQILALQQPVASDLRFLVICTRVLYEIERSGDLAVNIAKSVERVDGIPADPGLLSILGRLSEASSNMFARGVEAIATMDPEIGRAAEEEDELTDNLTSDLFKYVTEKQETLGLEVAVTLFYIGRFFERIADHGVNMAGNVTFAVTAHYPNEE